MASKLTGNLEKDVLKVGYLPITDAAPLLLAHGTGAYEKNGLSGCCLVFKIFFFKHRTQKGLVTYTEKLRSVFNFNIGRVE